VRRAHPSLAREMIILGSRNNSLFGKPAVRRNSLRNFHADSPGQSAARKSMFNLPFSIFTWKGFRPTVRLGPQRFPVASASSKLIGVQLVVSLPFSRKLKVHSVRGSLPATSEADRMLRKSVSAISRSPLVASTGKGVAIQLVYGPRAGLGILKSAMSFRSD